MAHQHAGAAFGEESGGVGTLDDLPKQEALDAAQRRGLTAGSLALLAGCASLRAFTDPEAGTSATLVTVRPR